MTIGKLKDQHTSGFTLLEVMLSMAILAISLVVVFQSQSQSISMTSRSRFDTTASLLAQSKMAEIEVMTSNEISSDSGDFGEYFPEYSWQVGMSVTDFEQVKKVEVTVINEKMKKNNSYKLILYRYVDKL